MSEEELLKVGGRLCLDFCNTVEHRGSERAIDFLAGGYPALLRWCLGAAVLDRGQLQALEAAASREGKAGEAVHAKAVLLREALYRLFAAAMVSETGSRADLRVLDGTVRDFLPRRSLQFLPGGRLGWTWGQTPSFEDVLGPIALSAVDLLGTDDLGRLRRCPGCGWLFYDQSRNRSRTWCDMQFCGNREKARRHVERQRLLRPDSGSEEE